MPAASMSASTASSAGRLPCTSLMTAITAPPTRASALVGLRQVLDALAGNPLRPVVLECVDQLTHEARRHVHARDDDARYLRLLDLVVDARECDGELVVAVADVR